MDQFMSLSMYTINDTYHVHISPICQDETTPFNFWIFSKEAHKQRHVANGIEIRSKRG